MRHAFTVIISLLVTLVCIVDFKRTQLLEAFSPLLIVAILVSIDVYEVIVERRNKKNNNWSKRI